MENIPLLFVVEVEYIPPPISLNTRRENFSFDFQNDSPIEDNNANLTDTAIPSDLMTVSFEAPPDPLAAREVQKINSLLNNLCSDRRQKKGMKKRKRDRH
ncbi:hypothetical protein PNOK_0102700 [Pyrrhoderma noxium]|uniref:Uncharacterized protein n=1 Tax=Pyrrhoderma noxium TaxID=2282107 RepID=A0A286UWH6_9AGAM|nr:hypothetical protein PNOK_0102700 [Pyrrhoderma noxium]